MLGGAILDALYERPLCCEPSLLALRTDMELPRRERGIHEAHRLQVLDATQPSALGLSWTAVLSAEVCEEVFDLGGFFVPLYM